VTHIESLGPSSLYQDIAQIQHTLFPLSNTVNTTQNLAHTLASFVRQGLSSLISAITYININNHDYEIAALAEPEFYNITEEFMIKLVNWTMGDTHSNAYWMEEGQRVNFSYWSYEKVELAVETYRNLTSEMYEADLR
jgi:hypothetical protein